MKNLYNLLEIGDVVLVGKEAKGVEQNFIGCHALILRRAGLLWMADLLPRHEHGLLRLYPSEIESIVDPHVARLLYGADVGEKSPEGRPCPAEGDLEGDMPC